MARTAFLSAALLAATASAHFNIMVPDSMVGGGDTSNQNDGPCAGFTPSSSDNAVDFHVGGDAVGVFDGHATSDWIIRGTLETDASGGWQQLYPVYRTRGEGRSCQPSVTVPEEWAGERGIIGVVGQAEDGFLYACAVVNFVEGTGESHDACRNGSSVSFTENNRLVELATGDSESPSGSASASPSPSASSDADSDNDDDDSAATTLTAGGLVGAVVSMVAVAFGAFVL